MYTGAMRKKKYRKVYALVNPLIYAMEGAAVTPEAVLDKLRQGELLAIEAFRTGTATVHDWQTLADMTNLTQSMARDGIGPEALEPAQRCEVALIEAHARLQRTGRLGTTGEGLMTMRDVYEYHDLQRQSVSRSVYEKHLIGVRNRIASKAPDVIVVNRRKK